MFDRDGRPTSPGQAFAGYGRIAKTEHLLRVVDPVDDTYRRQMNRQLGALGLVLDAIVPVEHEVHRRCRCPASRRGA